MIKFEWDFKKAASNQKKHGVSFEEAQTSFLDPMALVIPDPEHSDTEERFVLLGHSTHLRMLVVIHCYQEDDSVIRIISARKATKKESLIYEENL